LGATAKEVTPGNPLTVEFYLVGRPVGSSTNLNPRASFYIDSDTSAGTA
jgi:hypothetical protein